MEKLEEIIRRALKDAVFLGSTCGYKNMNELVFNDLVKHTIKKIEKIM